MKPSLRLLLNISKMREIMRTMQWLNVLLNKI